MHSMQEVITGAVMCIRTCPTDLSVWRETSQEIQRSLLQHFRELLTAGG